MSRANRTCRTCGKNFHYCEGCGFPDTYYENDYCSKLCYVTRNQEFIFGLAKRIEKLTQYFDDEMKEEFWKILELFEEDKCINIPLLKKALSNEDL